MMPALEQALPTVSIREEVLSKRDALRGYLLHMAVAADDPIDLSAEDFHAAFQADYSDFDDFDQSFANALIWLRTEGFVRFESLPSGTNGETTVIALVATRFGEQAVSKAAETMPAVKERSRLHVEIAGMFGRFIGELINTQT